jgi:hypothetical protein
MQSKSILGWLFAVVCLATSASAGAQSITTLFAGGNSGSAGGMVYFDVTIGAAPLSITGFDVNTANATAFGFQVYTTPGTYVGNAGTPGLWTLQATGSGTNAGLGNPSPIVLSNSFTLNANTTYGMALSLTGGAGAASLTYTNGTGSNQNYSNSDIALQLGAASNTQFGALFTPRVWNGTIYYGPVPEPASLCALGLGAAALLRRRRRK